MFRLISFQEHHDNIVQRKIAIMRSHDILLVGSVKVNFLSYRYRADKSTIFGMRGL